MRTLIIFIIMFLPMKHDVVIRDASDFVEVNYVYRYDDTDEKYHKRMVQIIWWEFRNVLEEDEDGSSRPRPQYVVKDFRVIWSESSSPQKVGYIIPRRRGRNWACLFYDKDDKKIREVISGWKIETHTTNDPEIDNRVIVSLAGRNKLGKIK